MKRRSISIFVDGKDIILRKYSRSCVFCGGERFRPSQAAREGSAVPPHLKVTLSNGIVVERKGMNSSLTVVAPSSNRTGQQLPNAFVEQLALDLPRFLQMSDREKVDTLQHKVTDLAAQLRQAQELLASKAADLTTARTTAEQLHDESTEELERSIRDIDTINAKVRDNLNREKAEGTSAATARSTSS